MNLFKLFILSFLLILFFSCEEKKEEVIPRPKWTTDHSSEVNKQFAKEEEYRIKIYIKQQGTPNYIETGSGLRYWIYEKTEGRKPESHEMVDVRFQMSLLDGTILYETEEREVSSFKVDRDDIESGLMEGIKYLSIGEKAKFIIPSPLAHGLMGDFEKVPPLEVILVDIELVKIY